MNGDALVYNTDGTFSTTVSLPSTTSYTFEFAATNADVACGETEVRTITRTSTG